MDDGNGGTVRFSGLAGCLWLVVALAGADWDSVFEVWSPLDRGQYQQYTLFSRFPAFSLP